MYERPEFNEKGEKILCLEDGKNSHMLMDVWVKRLAPGESVTLQSAQKETAVMLLAGEVSFAFEGRQEKGERRSVFLDKPYCLHVCRGKEVTVVAGKESRLLIQRTVNEREFETVFYTPEKCTLQEFGSTQWEGTAHRQVLTVFDYDNAPCSNMVMGEVFHKPGCWSSYPPHFHPQPELYYYEFDKPQGFGVGFDGEQCFKVEDQGCLTITPMNSHQQAAAPGYRMYYAWLIRHLEGDPWRKTRIDVPEHAWLMQED